VIEGSVLANLREEVRKRLLNLRVETQKAGVGTVEAMVLEGKPSVQIVHHAEALPADLIVMGTHGRSGFSHLMLGSVAERVARSAPCAVIAVPLKLQTEVAAE
jgi:nucleotide-binding universal stress UspA family protein